MLNKELLLNNAANEWHFVFKVGHKVYDGYVNGGGYQYGQYGIGEALSLRPMFNTYFGYLSPLDYFWEVYSGGTSFSPGTSRSDDLKWIHVTSDWGIEATFNLDSQSNGWEVATGGQIFGFKQQSNKGRVIRLKFDPPPEGYAK